MVYGFRQPVMLVERHALTAFVAVGLAGLVYLLLRRFETAAMRLRLPAALLAAAPPAALLSIINYNVMFVFAPEAFLHAMDMDLHLGLLGEVLYSAVENYFVFAAWAVLYTAITHAVQTRDLLHRAVASDAAAGCGSRMAAR